MGTTFDPANINTANIALSNGNLTATHTSAAVDIIARCNTEQTGRYTFSFSVGQFAPGHSSVGMASATSPTAPGAFLGGDLTSWGVTMEGAGHGTTGGSGTPYNPGDIVDFAVDIGGKAAWMRTNGGPWNGSSANVPGVSGGIAFATVTATAMTPAVDIWGTGDSATINPLPSYSVPGFAPWDTPPLVAKTDGAVAYNLTGNSISFVLVGGAYLFAVDVVSAGSIVLQRLGPDGVTWVNNFTPLSANGVQVPIFLPPGTYRFSGGSGIYFASVQRIKYA